MVKETHHLRSHTGDVADDTDPWIVGDLQQKPVWDSTPLPGHNGPATDDRPSTRPDSHNRSMELPMPAPTASRTGDAFLRPDAPAAGPIVRVILEDAGAAHAAEPMILGVPPSQLAMAMCAAAGLGAAAAFVVHHLLG